VVNRDYVWGLVPGENCFWIGLRRRPGDAGIGDAIEMKLSSRFSVSVAS